MTNPWPRGRSWAVMGVIFALGVGIDQLSKALAIAYLDPDQPVPLVSDIFQLRLLRNPGAAFSTGAGMTVVFGALAGLVLIGVIVAVAPRVRSGFWSVAVGLGTAGVAGNFVDRLVRPPGFLRGHVIDFFALKHFAVFNVADILLTTTAVLLILNVLFFKVDFGGKAAPEPTSEGV